ncbi:MAG TPA: Hpt domain-containing protein [Solirubrobacteraceae bacterium]|nr:Hpt domain-containing protein [Solirubrobacteraceae bacterium]
MLDEEDLRDLVELYFADVATQLEVLRDALAGDDPQTVSACAHRVKGASLSIGAARVASLAADIETTAKAGELSPCGDLLAALEADLPPTRSALGAELAVELPG